MPLPALFLPMGTARNIEDELIDEVASYDKDPRGWADFAYPWGEGELDEEEGLRTWQAEEFAKLGEHLQNPDTRFDPYQLAIASGHGIGKSAFLSMLLDWGMSTAEDCKVVITANTRTQLVSKTMAEVAKWRRLSITSHWFTANAMSVVSVDPSREKSWRTDAITWSKHNTEAFAGLHNKKKRIILIFDEGSAIDDAVWETAEGALTDEDTEIIWVVFGNPTRNTGRFRECFRRFRNRWRTRQIDSRDVEGTNKKQIQKWLEDHGEDSDFFKVRVRGMFPNVSAKQFIATDDVDAAFGRHLRLQQYNFAPKIITVEPAWTGIDAFVIALRQGLSFKILGVYPYNDNDIHMANIVARFDDDEKADAVFIDGGYGTGIYSAGKTWNRVHWRLVWFGEKSGDPGCVNKRAEMWKGARDWLKAGGAIPEDQELYDDLIGPETVPRMDGKLLLESKEDMKARGLPSPNKGDALALSFAFPVQARIEVRREHSEKPVGVDYNPLAR
jgi:hypothetical protein